MKIHQLVMSSFAQMLEALAGQLNKGAAAAHARGFDVGVLMDARLAPDMHPLTSQVQFVCTQAAEAANRLLGQALTAPPSVTNIDEAKEAIAKTIAFLRSLDPTQFEAAEERPIELKLANGMTFDLTGAEYVRSWAIPQFYFHLVTAYAILRHNGVDLGKADYVPHMFAYLRPPTVANEQ